MATLAQALRLNIGCGDTRRDGYQGVDIRPAAGADHIAAAWDLSAFAPGSVDEIYSRHMLEHLDPENARRSLRAWASTLRPDGRLRLIVPDLAFHAQQLLGLARNWTSDTTENQTHALAGFFGWRDESRGGNCEDAHRWGYTEDSLIAMLLETGFDRVERIRVGEDSEPWHLHVTAHKRRGSSPLSNSDNVHAAHGNETSSQNLIDRPSKPEPATDASVERQAAIGSSRLGPGRSATPRQAQAAADRVLADWRGRGRVAIFGAGAHTRKILPVLLRHGDRIAGITDDSPATWGTRIGRWDVGPPQAVVGPGVAGVLVSSDAQQRSLAERAGTEFGDRCAILTLYALTGADDDGPSLPSTGERQTARSLAEIELGHRARYHWAAQHLAPGTRVLDAACGNGYGSRILADSGAAVLGIDIAPDAIAFAAHHFGNDQIIFVPAAVDDGRSLQLVAERRHPFDAAVSLETLEHLERPELFLRDIAGLLRPGGQFFCSTPNAEVMDLAEAPYHRRHFTTQEVRELLTECGFELIHWFGQEGLQILPNRCTALQRYCLYHAIRR